jgi:hypothetical protein
VYAYDADFIPANFLSGKNIFGWVGTLVPGKKWASGSVAMTTATSVFYDAVTTSDPVSLPSFTVTGLAFVPSLIIGVLNYNSGINWSVFSIYAGNLNSNNADIFAGYTGESHSDNYVKGIKVTSAAAIGTTCKLPLYGGSTYITQYGGTVNWLAIE